MELRWSRVELSASCYRVCENAGTLALQVVRSGNSADPAYVGIHVEEGTARVGRDFTYSSAALLQFDPGVHVKTWNIYLKDDGLEENHEKFHVLLKMPTNVILGQRTNATVEIVDPRNGRCNPNLLVVEETEKPHPFPSPPPVQEPEPPLLEEYTPDPGTVYWENFPPRGDVPYRTDFSYYHEGEPQDQAMLNQGPLRIPVRSPQRIQSLTPLRLDKPLVPRVHSELQIQPIWTWSGYFSHPDSADAPQQDSPESDSVQQQKAQTSTGISCPKGWAHYRKSCYLLGPGIASWSSAQHTCQLLKSHLTSVHSQTDMRWIWNFAGKQSLWIGLTDGTSRWSWTDGQPLTFSRLSKDAVMNFQAFSGSAGSCVLAQTQALWVLRTCTYAPEHRYVCSAPAQIR